MAWLADSCVLDKWRQLHAEINGEEVPGALFISAARAIISIFDLISGMGIVKSDMVGNADQLNKLIGDRDITLQALVMAELAGCSDATKLAKDGKTATCALLWLNRALLFVYELLSEMVEKPESKLSECINKGYEKTLRQYHGFAVRTTFSVAVRAAPTRQGLMSKMGPSEEEVITAMREVIPMFSAVLQLNKKFLTEKSVESK
eukprot:CAMPEP_0119363736 /NCGR_PEP_ID=MMETSP1334-20130426/10666_1 /TAXON_ID=127549 /ORGANISM="Calcidiscus leptoporus, Strain RCC1130" /LENGTH=203 /DNA_ID=CAMNT_0007379267 /DNA_START=13 /DNA_END=624 /DNA_ORIENTATION=-